MPGPLTYAAIALMARDRLREIRDALRAKQTNGLRFTDVEKQILYLAEQAHALTSLTQPAIDPPLRLYGPPIGDQVSQFFLLGTVGPEIPAYSALFTPGQRWLRDTLHKGSPDEHRESVLVGSTDFAFEFWRRVEPRVREDAEDFAKMRAYVLGHLCHVAADVMASSLLDDVEWHLGSTTTGQRKLSREQIVGAIEVRIAADFFRRGTATRGERWGDWWPHMRTIPSAFFTAYKEALEKIYGPGARRPGFGAFEEQRTTHPPQELSEELLKDGYITFRTVVQHSATWDLGHWLGFVFPMIVPALVALPVAAALPNAKDLFRSTPPPGLDREAASYETLAFPFAINALVPLFYTFGLSFTTLGSGPEILFGWVSAGLQALSAVAFIIVTARGASAPRYLSLLVPSLLVEIAHIIFTLRHSGEGRQPRALLALSSIFHLGFSALFAVLYWAFLHLAVEGVNDEGARSGTFWVLFAVWLFILLVIWFLVSLLLCDRTSYRLPADDQANVFATGRPHHLRLFDEATLFHGPRPAQVPAGQPYPTLAHLHYPSGRRKLLKIWWEGDGEPTVLVHRDRLEFIFGGTSRTVHAPVAPTRPSEYAAFLERTVKDGNGEAKLKAKEAYAGDLDYELPAGWVFADHGDDQETEEAHATEAARPKPFGRDEASAYELYHAPKAHQAVRFDKSGPTLEAEERTATVAGVGVLTSGASDPRQITVSGPGATRFTRFFRPGDIVEAGVGVTPPKRVIVSVDSDTQITVSTPFPAPLTGAAFNRAAQNRRADTPAPAGWTVQSILWDPNDLNGAGGEVFGSFFRPGDVIRVLPPGGTPQERVVTAVVSDTRLKISRPLDPPLDSPQSSAIPLPAPVPFARVGEQPAELFGFVAGADDTLETGEVVMNHAADLATLLCLGATSHLLTDTERDRFQWGGAHDLNKVYQVFRNWNLDRRRVNEWRMLVLGGAVSERRGRPAEADPALPAGAPAVTLTEGEETANRLGWLPLLRAWVDMARRPDTDAIADTAFRPGNPTNRDLSRALAFLLDMRDPAAP